jgi:hypothetical protein
MREGKLPPSITPGAVPGIPPELSTNVVVPPAIVSPVLGSSAEPPFPQFFAARVTIPF